MRKEVLTHLLYFVLVFVVLSLWKRYFTLSTAGFFALGGLLGTILPDIDHLIYVYFLFPQDLTSQRVMYGLKRGKILDTFKLMTETRSERKSLIFHSAFFQVIFWILAFWVITSSGSVLGRGLVIAMSLHLLVDEILDFRLLGNLTNWFSQGPIYLSLDYSKEKVYLLTNTVIFLALSFLF